MKNKILHTLLIGFFCLTVFQAFSQNTFTNNGGTGNGLWATASNWSTGTVPATLIPNGTTITIAANCTYNGTFSFGIHGNLTINEGVNFTPNYPFIVYSDGVLTNNGTTTGSLFFNAGNVIIGGTQANPGTFTSPYEFNNQSTGILTINAHGTFKAPPINNNADPNLGNVNNNAGVININNNGTLEYRQSSIPSLASLGTINWNSGGALTIASTSNLTLTANLTVQPGKKLNILGAMTINSGVTLTNNGTITVRTINNNGTLINDGLMPCTLPAWLYNAGTLTGGGSQDCYISNTGIFSPGGAGNASCYLFNVPPGLAPGSVNLDINGTTPCFTNGHDQIRQLGNNAYAQGILNLNFGSYVPPYGTEFQIIQATGSGTHLYSGNFSAVNVTPNTILASYNQYTGRVTIIDPCPPPLTVVPDYQTLEATQADINWQAIIGATGYQLQFKKHALTTWSASRTTTTYTDRLTNLEARTEYDVRVRTSCNNGTSYSTWSAVSTFSTAHGTKLNGNWDDPNTWANNQIPTENDPAFVSHIVTVNSSTAVCLRLGVRIGTINIPTAGVLTVGTIDMVNQTGGADWARFSYYATLNMTGGTFNIGGQLNFGEWGVFNMTSGTININGGGNPLFQGLGIEGSSLFINYNTTVDLQGGTIRIFPPSFNNAEQIIEANKDFGNFNTCVGATVILERTAFTAGTYKLGGLNIGNLDYHPNFYNLILRGETTNMNAILVKNALTLDQGTLNRTGASTFGTLTQLNSPTIAGAGTHTLTGVCTIPPMTTVQNGDWTSPSTWSNNRLPTATDDITIGHTVTHSFQNSSVIVVFLPLQPIRSQLWEFLR